MIGRIDQLTRAVSAILPRTGALPPLTPEGIISPDRENQNGNAETTDKKKPATKRCGLQSNFLRRRLEETGATIATAHCRVCFIVAIADIHHPHNCCSITSSTSPASSTSRHLSNTVQGRRHRPWRSPPLRSHACTSKSAHSARIAQLILMISSRCEVSCKHDPPWRAACQATLRRPGSMRALARFFS
jgi:hypothetical protein